MLGKILAPLGFVLILVGVGVAILTFVFVLLDLTGDFPSRVNQLTGATSLPFILGGAALGWSAKGRT